MEATLKYSRDGGRNWGVVQVENRQLREILSKHWLNHPIDEIERHANGPTPAGTFVLPFLLDAIRGAVEHGIQLPDDTGLEVTTQELGRVVAAVRNELLSRLLAAEDCLTQSSTAPEWDAFISHANEDKEAFVRPLANALQRRGLKVWFDEFTLSIGDSLRRSIDQGLANSRFGIVVISPDFLHKEWPQRELDGLVAREVDGIKVILPVWHRITRQQVVGYSPLLADRLAAASDRGLDYVVAELLRAIVRDNRTQEANSATYQAQRGGGTPGLNESHPSYPTPTSPVTDLWVNMEYPQKLGVIDKLTADGYELKWERASDEAASIDLEGWEHVIIDRPDGTCVRLKIHDAPMLGGYVVLLKRRKR